MLKDNDWTLLMSLIRYTAKVTQSLYYVTTIQEELNVTCGYMSLGVATIQMVSSPRQCYHNYTYR